LQRYSQSDPTIARQKKGTTKKRGRQKKGDSQSFTQFEQFPRLINWQKLRFAFTFPGSSRLERGRRLVIGSIRKAQAHRETDRETVEVLVSGKVLLRRLDKLLVAVKSRSS
jgi:hypothetical protein